jgi:hypothetical protein
MSRLNVYIRLSCLSERSRIDKPLADDDPAYTYYIDVGCSIQTRVSLTRFFPLSYANSGKQSHALNVTRTK